MRLIDADAAKIRVLEEAVKVLPKLSAEGAALALGLAELFDCKSDFPTIEADPVKHGKWLDCDYKKLEHGFVETYPNAGMCCSNCRTGFKKEIVEGFIFCPNCGARMEGGVSDEIH